MRLYTVQYAAYCTVLGFPVEVNFRKNIQNLAKILFRILQTFSLNFAFSRKLILQQEAKMMRNLTGKKHFANRFFHFAGLICLL